MPSILCYVHPSVEDIRHPQFSNQNPRHSQTSNLIDAPDCHLKDQMLMERTGHSSSYLRG